MNDFGILWQLSKIYRIQLKYVFSAGQYFIDNNSMSVCVHEEYFHRNSEGTFIHK